MSRTRSVIAQSRYLPLERALAGGFITVVLGSAAIAVQPYAPTFVNLLVGIAVLALIFLRPHLGVYILVLTLWLSPYFTATGGLTLNRAVGLATLAGVLGQRALRIDRRPLQFGRFDLALLLYVGVALLSGLVNGTSARTFEYLWDLAMGYLLFWLMRDQIITRHRLHAILVIMVASTLIGGMETVTTVLTSGGTSAQRVYGALQVNAMGRQAWMAIILCLWLASEWRSIWRLLPMLCVPILGAILVLTGSRTALLSLALAWAVLLFVGKDSRRLALWAAALLGLAIASIALLAPNTLQRALNLGPVVDTLLGRGADESRIVLWDAAWRMFRERPILGWGLGNFQIYLLSYTRYQLWASPHIAHSLLFSTLAELGVAGLGALYGVCMAGPIHAVRAAYVQGGDRTIYMRIIVRIGWFTAMFAHGASISRLLLCIAALISCTPTPIELEHATNHGE